MLFIIQFVRFAGEIIVFLLLARAILSWFATNPYAPAYRWYQFTVKFTEPIVAPCRRWLGRFDTGMFDFSVFFALILVQIATSVIIRVLLLIYTAMPSV